MYEIIKKSIADVKELEITPEDITVLFIPDMMEQGLGDEIIVEVGKILDRPRRSIEVLCQIAEGIGKSLVLFTREWKSKEPDLIEVFVEVFGNPEKTAFWISPPKKHKK